MSEDYIPHTYTRKCDVTALIYDDTPEFPLLILKSPRYNKTFIITPTGNLKEVNWKTYITTMDTD